MKCPQHLVIHWDRIPFLSKIDGSTRSRWLDWLGSGASGPVNSRSWVADVYDNLLCRTT